MLNLLYVECVELLRCIGESLYHIWKVFYLDFFQCLSPSIFLSSLPRIPIIYMFFHPMVPQISQVLIFFPYFIFNWIISIDILLIQMPRVLPYVLPGQFPLIYQHSNEVSSPLSLILSTSKVLKCLTHFYGPSLPLLQHFSTLPYLFFPLSAKDIH